MVKIRLKRVGKAKQPSYRVVVADSRFARDGRIIEAIGHYNPRTEPSVVEIDADRAVHWLEQGAQPSDAVRKLLEISGAWQAFSGEAPPAKPTAAASVTATPAASTEEDSPEAAPQEDSPEATVEEASAEVTSEAEEE